MYILPSRMDSSCAMNYCYSLFAYIIVYYCGSNHTEHRTACGLILALVVPCCSSMLCSVAQADLIGSNHTELMRAHTCSCCALAEAGSVGSSHTESMRACGLIYLLLLCSVAKAGSVGSNHPELMTNYPNLSLHEQLHTNDPVIPPSGAHCSRIFSNVQPILISWK